MSTAAPTLALPPAGHDRPRRVVNTAAFLLGLANAMVFGGLFAAYLQMRHASAEWPPIEIDNYLGGTMAVTLGLSAVTVEWFAWGVRTGNRRQAMWAGVMTLGFGLAFLNLLWYALAQAGFGPADSTFGALFFTLSIAAGITAAIGFVFVLAALLRAAGHLARPGDDDVVRAAAWYWQFVVVSWVVAGAAIYIFQHK